MCILANLVANNVTPSSDNTSCCIVQFVQKVEGLGHKLYMDNDSSPQSCLMASKERNKLWYILPPKEEHATQFQAK
jgi:hypothetical protein